MKKELNDLIQQLSDSAHTIEDLRSDNGRLSDALAAHKRQVAQN